MNAKNASYAVIAWSVLYGAFHLYWLLGGAGYPFHNAERNLFEAIITYLPAQVGGGLFVGLCLLGLLVSVEMRRSGRVIPSWLILACLWGSAVALILFVPDSSLIAALAYAFLLKFDFNWQMLNQVFCILGALSFGFAALSFQRKIRNACPCCGRAEQEKPFVLVRWGKWITYVAVLAPMPYAISRYAWALGIPLGVDPDVFQDLSGVTPIHRIIEWTFGSLCVAGGLLTLGLIQKWGERLPDWFPFVGGKRVPVLLAVIPAACIAIALTSAGIVFTSSFIAVEVFHAPADSMVTSQLWGAVGPMLFWIPWGVALGLAAIAYYYRRRGQCGRCGLKG